MAKQKKLTLESSQGGVTEIQEFAKTLKPGEEFQVWYPQTTEHNYDVVRVNEQGEIETAPLTVPVDELQNPDAEGGQE